jgi:hypothetical protein
MSRTVKSVFIGGQCVAVIYQNALVRSMLFSQRQSLINEGKTLGIQVKPSEVRLKTDEELGYA